MLRLARFGPGFVAAIVLATLALASGILFHSLETDRLVERARQERFMRNAAFSVVDDLGAELFTMYSAFGFDLMTRLEVGQQIGKPALVEAVRRYQAQARFPGLLLDLTCLTADEGGSSYMTWSEKGWISDGRPSWAPDLVAAAAPLSDGTVGPRKVSVFSLENPVLTIPMKVSHPKKGTVLAVSLRFSAQVILGQVVPALVRQRFSESQDALPYRALVRNQGYHGGAPEPLSDWEIPLLPEVSFETWFDYYLNRIKTMNRSRVISPPTEEGLTAGSDGWVLSVYRLPGGLEAEMSGLFLRNVLLSLGFFALLSSGFLALYGSVHRAQKLAQQERNFLALISHELKTPLAVVRSLADNLARGIGTDEARAREYGVVLQGESERLGRMIGNVLGLTSLQGGIPLRDRCPVDLGAVVKERLSRQEPENLVDVEVSIHPGLPPVQGHPAALSAAVDNLVGNAFRHGATGPGRHRIVVSVVPRRRWGIRGVEFSVTDDGPGFSRKEGRSFRRPFRRGSRAQEGQVPGGGVGLSLVRVTARALGGSLRWSSRPGRGARFSLWLREALR